MIHTTQEWKIGDCVELMRELPTASVDLIVTDPPYGYSFMGKEWDKAVPSVDVWQECLRVLKPGAFAFIMSAPRQDVLAHNLVNLSAAGFETGFTSIYWTFASGFPKAGNIGKMVDKRNGRQPEQYVELGKYLREMRGGRPQKDIAKFFPSKTGGLTGCVANWELGLNVPTKIQWGILKRELHLDDRFNELIEREEAEREITGIDKKRSLNGNTYTCHSNKDSLYWDRKDAPATPQGKELDGSYGGFQPKPAVEVIMVVMKPLSEKTYVDQALANGKGITWLDDGRIPIAADDRHEYGVDGDEGNPCVNTHGERDRVAYQQNAQGRFPANLLVGDCVLNSGDSGSFSRYFNLDAWWGARIKHLPKEVQKTFPFMIVPKASKSEKGEDNKHPTVKSVKLFSWLIIIGSREGYKILDPFLGSGTTLEAGRSTNRNVIGFEVDPPWEHLYPDRCMAHTPPLTAYSNAEQPVVVV